jgi:hypothetical protein
MVQRGSGGGDVSAVLKPASGGGWARGASRRAKVSTMTMLAAATRDSLLDPGRFGRGMDGAVELAGREQLDRVAARK